MMQAQSTPRWAWTHLLIAVLITPVSALAIFWATSYVVAKWDQGWHPVWFGDSSNAQIIVLSDDQSPEGFSVKLIPVFTTTSYRAAYPGCTFLVPTGRKKSCAGAAPERA